MVNPQIQRDLGVRKNILFEEILSSRGRIKVLKILLERTELAISQITKLANLNHNSVDSHLDHLIQVDVVQRKIFGRVKIYRLRLEDSKVLAIKDLFALWEDEVRE